MTDQGNRAMEYKGYTIKLNPHQELCSNFALVVINPEGKEIKHSCRAGETQDKAFEFGKRLVDFEVGYSRST